MRDRVRRPPPPELLDDDPRVALVLADISADSFAPAARGHPDRVINVGIREQLHDRRRRRPGADRACGRSRTRIAPFLVERPFEQIKLTSATRASARSWSASARRTTTPSAVAPTRRPATSRCSTRCRDWTVHVPGHPDEVGPLLRQAVAAATTGSTCGCRNGPTPRHTAADGRRLRHRPARSGRRRRRGRADARSGARGDRRRWTSPCSTPPRRARSTPRAAGRRPGPRRSSWSSPIWPAHRRAGRVGAARHATPGARARRHRREVRRYGTMADHDRLHGLDAPAMHTQIASFLRERPRPRTM